MIVCTNTTCPLVQKYLPKLKRLDEKYRGQGVQFVSLNVDPGDSIREMAAHAVGFDLAFPTVKDINGETVAALGVTPDAGSGRAERRSHAPFIAATSTISTTSRGEANQRHAQRPGKRHSRRCWRASRCRWPRRRSTAA